MSMAAGDEVNWGDGTANGTVDQTYTRSVTRKIEGLEVTRNGPRPSLNCRRSLAGFCRVS